jgi:ABC-type nitrate/sulfonate/bicarbonate transport system permease component
MGFVLGPCTLLFSIPLIVLVPIIGMTTDPSITPIICSALLVYYPVLLLFMVGLQNVPNAVLNYAESTGAGRVRIFANIRTRYALPGLAAGFQAALPFAFLGSMLGELTGARWGLGAYLLATMAQANPSKEWGIFLTTAVIAGTASWLSGLVWSRAGLADMPVTSSVLGAGSMSRSVLGITAALFFWELAALRTSDPYFIKGPSDVISYFAHMPHPEASVLFHAAWHTLASGAAGLIAGIATGFILALALHAYSPLRSPLLMLALITQAVPIIALVPLYVALFGRGAGSTLAIATSATFFPCFTSIYQGLQSTPRGMLEFANSAGAATGNILRRISILAATPFVFAAIRLATPRVLLGVTLAEYLSTREGLGAILFEARGALDFRVIWAIALCIGVIAMAFTALVEHLERRSLSRYT